MAHIFNPSTWEAEAAESLGLRPTWSTEQVPGQNYTEPMKSQFSEIAVSVSPPTTFDLMLELQIGNL